MLIRFLAMLVAVSLAACSFMSSGDESEESSEVTEGVDPSKDPFGALGALAEMGLRARRLAAGAVKGGGCQNAPLQRPNRGAAGGVRRLDGVRTGRLDEPDGQIPGQHRQSEPTPKTTRP